MDQPKSTNTLTLNIEIKDFDGNEDEYNEFVSTVVPGIHRAIAYLLGIETRSMVNGYREASQRSEPSRLN